MTSKDLYSSWDLYREQVALIQATKGQCDDGRCYLPNPDEIEQRKQELDWLKEMGFGPCAIESIMRYDHPTIDWIDRQINQRGKTAAEVIRRIEPLLICPRYEKL